MSKIKLGEHIRIIPGFPFNSALFNNDGDGMPLIRIRDLLASKIETYYKGEFSKEYLIEEGDILIGMDGDFHIVKWRNKTKALLNQRIMKVAQKEGAKINIEYFYYFLFPFLSDVWEKTTATTVKHLSTYDVSEAEVEFPAFEVQQRIAKILSTADAVIEKTQSAIAKYKAIKQGLLYDLFTRGLVAEPTTYTDKNGRVIELSRNQLRPRYEDAPGLYKESKLGLIPSEWEILPVSSVSENLDGARIPVKQEDRDKQREVFPYYGASGIIDYVEGYIFDEPLILLGEDGENVISRNLPLAFKVSGKIWVNNHAHVLRPIPTVVTIDFLCEILESINYSTIVSGTAQPKITQGALSAVLLPIPKMDEQLLMSERIVSITKKLQTEQTYLQKMQSLKKGLMVDLLSGKKQVKILEPETSNSEADA